jgi:hypothetical protein
MGDKLKHANPDTYTSDLQEALGDFEEALLRRYEADCDDLIQIWTTHGNEPEHPGDLGFGKEERFDDAKKHLSEWAADGRDLVRRAIVDYGTQDLNKLESAFDDFRSAADLLGINNDPGEDGKVPANLINSLCDFDAWAGASGEAFRKNFGESCVPTMVNQGKIATSLASLYAARTCIIESVRRNTVNAIKSAADGLRETEDSGEETGNWFVVGVIGIAVGLAVPPVAGAVISAGTLTAGTLDSEYPDQKFSHDIKEIVDTLVYLLGQASVNLEEDMLFDKIVELQTDIKGVKSKELELYDFTGGEYSSAAPADGFDVSVDDIYKLSELCSVASRAYEIVIAKVVPTDDADDELKGEGHVETAADAELIDTKNALVSFLKTTCARYYEASDRLHDTARDYSGVETDNEEKLKGADGGPDFNGDGDGKGGSVDKHVKESDRDDIDVVPESTAGGVEYGSGGV